MEQLASAPPDGPVGALLRTFRHRACLSQERLAARAELSERTVRNLEAGRVRSPRAATVRLLADALELGEPERESWFVAARGANGRQAEPAIAGAGGPAQLPRRLTVAVLTGYGQGPSGLAITCLIDKAGETVLAVLQTVELDRGGFACALGGPGRTTLFIVAAEWRGITEPHMVSPGTGQV